MSRISTHKLYNLFDKWSPFIFIFSVATIVIATLFPFNFSRNLAYEITDLSHAFRHPTNFTDAVNNVLLFIPFGFGLSTLINKYRASIVGIILIIFIASASLSFTVEMLQILLPSRASTIADIVNNSIGGLVGFLCFHLWKYKITNSAWRLIEKIRNSLSVRNLTITAIAYTGLCLAIAVSLPFNTSLSNWDTQFSLQLGNEATGDRPWRGSISSLAIADRAISQTEVANAFDQNRLLSVKNPALITAYQFTGKDNLMDITGNSPQLSWQGKAGTTEDSKGVFLSGNRWLKTSSPATSITEKIRRHSQFTLSTTFATAQTPQTGPARIISLSQDAHKRNFTLSQDGADLAFRLRLPITGDNGSKPQLMIPGFFTNNQSHRLIITYNGSTIKFYIDSLSNVYALNFYPGFAFCNFLGFLGNGWDLYLNGSYQFIYNGFYYILTFIIFGIILALFTKIVRPRIIFYSLVMPILILLPPIILEAVLSNQTGRDWQWENVIFSMVIISIPMVGLKLTKAVPMKKILKSRGQAASTRPRIK